MHVGELEADPARHHPLLAAGIHEQQIFLPVVEEAEIALGIARAGRRRRRGRRQWTRGSRVREMMAGRPGVAASLFVSMKARMRSSVSVVMRPPLRKPRGELAVIDGAAAEGRFREPAVAAIVGDFLQESAGRS